MTEPRALSRLLLTMTAPIAGLSTAGILTAAAHLKLATFALGAWTFPLAIVAPGVIAGRMLTNNHGTWRTSLICLGAIALNLAIEALGTAAQLAMLNIS